MPSRLPSLYCTTVLHMLRPPAVLDVTVGVLGNHRSVEVV
jgi:hypothetical protein